MAANYNPDDPIEGGRVYSDLSESELQTRANAGHSGYTVAHEFLTRLEGELKDDSTDSHLGGTVKNGLTGVPIDALGFEVEVDAAAAATPFDPIQGTIGIAVVWFTDPPQGVSTGPHVYLFTRYESGSPAPLGPAPNQSAPLEGCFFVVNGGGKSATSLSPVEWESVLPAVGVGAGAGQEHPFIGGEAMLYPATSVQRFLRSDLAASATTVLFVFGSTFAVGPPESGHSFRVDASVRRPFTILDSRYAHDQWLLEQLGFLEAPAGSSWTGSGHSSSKQGAVRIPHWSGSSSDRPRMSLALAALAEEDYWLSNRDPWTKFEENDGQDQLERITAYYQFTIDNSVFNVTLPDEAVKATEDKRAWSAVFISYVVGKSGVEKDAGFAFSIRHITYIAHAHLNRKNADRSKPFWLYRPEEIDPRKGDILCKLRKGGRDVDFGVLDGYIEPSPGDQDYQMAKSDTEIKGGTHCDIVVRSETVDGSRYLETIGGNTFDYRVPTVDTAGRKRWKEDADGNWIMVGTDNKELGGGSTTPNSVFDPSESEDKTAWEPHSNYEDNENKVFGFIRDVSR